MEKLATYKDLQDINDKFLAPLIIRNKYATYDTITSATDSNDIPLFIVGPDPLGPYKSNQLIKINNISSATPTPPVPTYQYQLIIKAGKGSNVGYRTQINYNLTVNGDSKANNKSVTSDSSGDIYYLNNGDSYSIQVNSAMYQDSFSSQSYSTTNYSPKSWSGTMTSDGFTFTCRVNK